MAQKCVASDDTEYTNYVDINTDVLVTNEKSSNVTEAKVKSN